MIIALAGATGLTGGHALRLLLDHPRVTKVISLGRRKLPLEHEKLEELPFSAAPSIKSDAFLSCLGTTIKKAGSQEAFEQIDVDLPLEIARALKSNGCRSAAVVSAIGAAPESRIFYNRAKGKMEEGMKRIGFESLSILRPSIIMGAREEARIAEGFGKLAMSALSPLLIGGARKYRPIEAEAIARALVKLAIESAPGTSTYESNEIEMQAK
jgi:uncharacterized protein YbjT (DUF2867 family)